MHQVRIVARIESCYSVSPLHQGMWLPEFWITTLVQVSIGEVTNALINADLPPRKTQMVDS